METDNQHTGEGNQTVRIVYAPIWQWFRASLSHCGNCSSCFHELRVPVKSSLPRNLTPTFLEYIIRSAALIDSYATGPEGALFLRFRPTTREPGRM